MDFEESVLHSIGEANKLNLCVSFTGDTDKISITVKGKWTGSITEEVSKDIKYNIGEGGYNNAVAKRIDLMVNKIRDLRQQILYGYGKDYDVLRKKYEQYAEGTWGKGKE